MSKNSGQTPLEISAQTVDEAIENGLNQLKLREDQVEIEILDRGNKGLFGLGTRLARVRLSIKILSENTPPPSQLNKPEGLYSPEKKVVDEKSEHAGVNQHPLEDISSGRDTDEDDLDDGYLIEDEEDQDDFDRYETPRKTDITFTADEEKMANVARITVEDLLERMKVRAEVSASYIQPESEGQRPTLWVDINGNDLSILIGRRSQTLQALQYISSLIVGKELGKSIPVVIDVEGYRSRRQAQLRRLAITMAEQTVKTGRRQALEPMPASERRIVHMELRNFPGVRTESIGDEPHRKVTIIPSE
jgi:spoIIIJ-associated protein